MPDILHRVGIKSSSPNDTYKALTTHRGPRRLVDARTRKAKARSAA